MIIVWFLHLFFERLIVGVHLFLMKYIKSYDFHFTVNDGDARELPCAVLWSMNNRMFLGMYTASGI